VVSSDPWDHKPLTSYDLLLLRAGSTMQPGVFVKEELYHKRIYGRFPGKDCLMRSVQVNTRSSLFCRPIHNFAYLNPHVIN